MSVRSTYFKTRVLREIKKGLHDITPPIINRIIFGKKYLSGRQKTGPEDQYANRITINYDHIDLSYFEYLVGDPVLMLPIEKARYSGGISYLHNGHQMRQFYKGGIKKLKAYYSDHCPEDIFEKQFLKSPRSNLPESGLPWIGNSESEIHKEKPGGEKGLSAEGHGIQHYGPVSEQKLAMEAERLRKVLESLVNRGYTPNYGFSGGYFLENDKGEWVFHIIRGQHRVAAMAELDYTHVPVQMLSSHNRIIRQERIDHWPMVRDGILTKAEAQQIFDSFFPQNRELIFAAK